MIIAVDYDGTLWDGKSANINLIQRLKRAQSQGNIVILWTCRDGKRLMEAMSQLQAQGFKPNYVNSNCPEAIRMLGHDSRKIYADVYIDDKATR